MGKQEEEADIRKEQVMSWMLTLSPPDNSLRQWLSLFLIYGEETQDQRGEGTSSGLHRLQGGTATDPPALYKHFGLPKQGQAPGRQAGGHLRDPRNTENIHFFPSSSRTAGELEAAGDYVKVGGAGWGWLWNYRVPGAC